MPSALADIQRIMAYVQAQSVQNAEALYQQLKKKFLRYNSFLNEERW